jgi:hypothetical protein
MKKHRSTIRLPTGSLALAKSGMVSKIWRHIFSIPAKLKRVIVPGNDLSKVILKVHNEVTESEVMTAVSRRHYLRN